MVLIEGVVVSEDVVDSNGAEGTLLFLENLFAFFHNN